MLKQILASVVEVREIDVDRYFDLGDEQFGLVCALGILYHLKNPLLFLETVARHTRYCVLSTRIARFLADRHTNVSQAPVAYLLGEKELNADNSNYWIFSEAGLRRAFERTGWRVRSYMTIGGSGRSDPVSECDERAFCLLESRHGLRDIDLSYGWHAPEQERLEVDRTTIRSRVTDKERLTVAPSRVCTWRGYTSVWTSEVAVVWGWA
jgi:hypothetical protein